MRKPTSIAANGRSASTSIDLGQAQAKFEAAQKAWHASERALARAQEQRDRDKAAYALAEEQLKSAARTVLG